MKSIKVDKTKEILLYTPLLRSYSDNGLKITTVHNFL